MQKPTFEEVKAIDLTELHGYTKNGRSVEYFNADPGKEHYKLLAWLASQFDNVKLAEVGTLDGCGALALAFNPKNKVTTYDVRFYDDCTGFPKNVTRKLVGGNYDFMVDVVKCPVIFYDTNHDGILEREFITELKKRNYKGVVIFDDIYLNEPMKQFWKELDVRKEDWTDIGHHSGSGVAFFE